MESVTESISPAETIAVDIPAEPAVGSVVLDAENVAWQARGHSKFGQIWVRTGTMVPMLSLTPVEGMKPWHRLLPEDGPVTLVHRAGEPRRRGVMRELEEQQHRNRRLAANIAEGKSPFTAEILATILANAKANLDVPGPRVLQLLQQRDTVLALLERAERDGIGGVANDKLRRAVEAGPGDSAP